jgi:hypothetical protein
MKRVSAHVAATSLVVAIALVFLSAVTAYAEPKPDNPGNHYGKLSNPGHHYGQLSNPGHHYGWYKHPQSSPPVSPPAVTPPSTTPSPTTSPGDAGGSSSGSGVASQDIGAGPTRETSGIGNLPITLPVQELPSNQFKLTASTPSGPLEWLVLLILPALLAVWVMVFTRALITARRRRMATQPA